MEATKVYQDERLIGEVYLGSNGLWVAQLDRAISIRSQSFRTQEEAINALGTFKPEQLAGNPELAQLEVLNQVFNKLFNV